MKGRVPGGLLLTVLCAVLLAPGLVAQGEGSLPGLPGSARGAGMGGAGAALVGDAGAIFANPAGLATIHHLAVEGAYEAYPGGTTLSTGALALRVSRFTWGAGAAALGPNYNRADVLGVSSLVFRTGVVALGTSIKYGRETIGGARPRVILLAASTRVRRTDRGRREGMLGTSLLWYENQSGGSRGGGISRTGMTGLPASAVCSSIGISMAPLRTESSSQPETSSSRSENADRKSVV